MIIADADVWIDYFKNPASSSGQVLGQLLDDDQVLLIGMVLTEIMRGARTDLQERTLREHLAAVPYGEMGRAAWERAGSIAQGLDHAGQSLAVPDVIVAAVALEGDHELYTRDNHFERIPGLRPTSREEMPHDPRTHLPPGHRQ
jgi:predicted nucleic acid-binding protein